LADRQHGVVSRAQLGDLGLDRFAVVRRVANGQLHQLYRDVYAVGHASVSREGTYLAAVLSCGPDTALSHRSAADIWGLRRDRTRVEVTVPTGRIGPRGLVVHRSRMMEPVDFRTVDGIRVTSVARTLLDLAMVLYPRDLSRAVDRAERLRLFDLTELEDLLAWARGRRGAAALRGAIVGWRPADTRSELEDRSRDLIASLPLPEPQFNVLIQGERTSHEVDAYWPDHSLVVQLDGFAYHRTRRDRERDASADADLELAGNRIMRLTWDDVVAHRGRTQRRLGRLLGMPLTTRDVATRG
jgi:hypothetical protein